MLDMDTNSPNMIAFWGLTLRGRILSSPTVAWQSSFPGSMQRTAKLQFTCLLSQAGKHKKYIPTAAAKAAADFFQNGKMVEIL